MSRSIRCINALSSQRFDFVETNRCSIALIFTPASCLRNEVVLQTIKSLIFEDLDRGIVIAKQIRIMYIN